MGGASAAFVVDPIGRPGFVRYSVGYAIHVTSSINTPAMTVQKCEAALVGADGSVYADQLFGSIAGLKLGGTSRITGSDCPALVFEDRDITHPVAARLRARAEYTFDASPGDTHVLTGEKAVASSVPPLPVMTSLSLTSDVPGQPPMLPQLRAVRFVASGSGGTPPYQYQWQAAGNVLRDWSSDPTFVWDGTLPGASIPPTSLAPRVLARSNGSTGPEVANTITVFVSPH